MIVELTPWSKTYSTADRKKYQLYVITKFAIKYISMATSRVLKTS